MILQVDRLSKSFGSRTLFDDLSFVIRRGERVGLVGRNGTGKSTLLKMISGDESVDSGSIACASGVVVGYLQQHLRFTQPTVLDEAAQHLPLEEGGWRPLYRAQEILSGLGIDSDKQAASPALLSGGEQLRVSLAIVLLSNPDLLLLDEPTNYLDIAAISWLQRYLRQWRSGLLITTHDRTFLDSVCTHVLGIHRGKSHLYAGNTGHYYRRIEEEEERHERTVANSERRRKEVEQFIERFRYKASKAKSVQSRVKMLERQGELQHLTALDTLSFKFREAPFPGKRLLQVRNLGFRYPGGPWLFRNLSFDLLPDDRLAVVGPNGKGKSTLIRLLAGELEPTEGEIQWHPEARFGYFGQTNVERLQPTWSVEEAIGNAAPELTISAVRALCGAMMFSGDDAAKKISLLSGGEKSRVLLGRLLVSPAQLLLLDEPTHHLDLESTEALLNAIDQFDGAVVLVSHSEGVVNRISDRLVLFDEGGASIRDEGLSSFLEKGGWGGSRQSGERGEGKISERRVQKRARAQLIEERSKVLKPLRQQNSALEKKISQTEGRISELHQLLTDASLSGDGEKISLLSVELAQSERLLEEQFESWAALSETIAQAEQEWNGLSE